MERDRENRVTKRRMRPRCPGHQRLEEKPRTQPYPVRPAKTGSMFERQYWAGYQRITRGRTDKVVRCA